MVQLSHLYMTTGKTIDLTIWLFVGKMMSLLFNMLSRFVREELPRVQGQGWWPRVPGCDSVGAVERSYPMSEVRGSGREELPHVQGVVAATVQEGTGGPRGATPRSRSGGAAVRRYPSSKVRSSGCALLEQP